MQEPAQLVDPALRTGHRIDHRTSRPKPPNPDTGRYRFTALADLVVHRFIPVADTPRWPTAMTRAGAHAFLVGAARRPVPLAALQPDVWRPAHTLSTYDAAYVALANHLDAPLLTGARRIAAAPGVTCEVVTV
ncbi:hypothetical protein J1G42_02760 [Cellulomonas sp. zg-ZUI222]|uniref:hypothetical protein n=1 Tax=Cellulomonas wangleii TaxID=2816956 RepID=UPI001A941B39|nr:hypothetical protein [Cellulomonas wangleii]MBO0919745.1 hypothetical protein [Cellulomonas wangleii]